MNNNKSDFEFSLRFINFIRSYIPDAKQASGGKELIVKCKYCNDTKGHMYIKVPQSPEDVSVFNCFLCHTSGVIDSRRLLEWSMYDPMIGNDLDGIIKTSAKHFKSNIGKYSRIVYKFNNVYSNKDLALKKLDYINNRLGLNLSLYDALNNKIILNLKEAVDYNSIYTEGNDTPKYTRHINIMNQLNDHFVGFLSFDNNFVNLRRMCDEHVVYESIDRRYINYNIHDKQDNTEKFYIMPSKINLNSVNRVQIHVAEGPFDILSIRFNLRKDPIGIYASIGGSGYKGLIMYIINTLKIYYFDLHVYPDNDGPGGDNVMYNLAQYVKPYGCNVFIHRNIYNGEKDFGVPLDRIKESVTII